MLQKRQSISINRQDVSTSINTQMDSVVDTDKVKREESHYQPIPIINDFKDADGNDCMKQAIQDNYNRIKEDVKQIVKDELERIAADENLKHLIQKA